MPSHLTGRPSPVLTASRRWFRARTRPEAGSALFYLCLPICGVACLLYLATLSRHYTGDSIEYALAIESGQPALLLDPYHPLLHPAGLLFYRLWQAAGWTGRSLLPLQVLNALAGGLCAGLLTPSAGALSRSAAVAAVAGLGFALSGGPWMLGVEAEFVTPPLATMLAVLWAVLGASPGAVARSRYPLLLGLLTVAAIAGYVNSVLLIPVVLVALLTDRRLAPGLRRRYCLIYLATVLLIFVPAYAVFLAAWSGGEWEPVLAYFSGGAYGRVALFDIPHGVYAFLRGLALYPNLSLTGTTRQFLAGAPPTGRLLFAAYYALVLLAAAAPIYAAWRRRRGLWQAEHRALLVLGTWTALFAAFAFYWVPGDQSFWLPVLAAWWLLVALVLRASEVRGLRLAAVLAAVAALGVANALFEMIPRRDIRRNAAYQVAAQVIAHTAPQETALVRADDMTGLYLAYFGDRHVVGLSDEAESLAQALSPAEGMGPPARLLIADSDPERADEWEALVRSAGCPGAQGWLASTPGWQAGTGLVLELTCRPAP